MKEEDYGDKFKDHLIEQYKLFVETATLTSKRRDNANRFYVVLLSGLLASLALMTEKGILSENQNFLFFIFGAVGLIICGLWLLNIESYAQLIEGKFLVIEEIEKKLPFNFFTKEWEIIKKEKGKKTAKGKEYFEITKVEKCIPVIFALPYLMLVIVSLYNLFFMRS